MSSSLEPSSSTRIEEETSSVWSYTDSMLDVYDVHDPEEVNTQELFDKPRGQKRWIGKEHHRGKERLHNNVKDRTFIEKTIKATEPLSKNATKKIEASTRDGLDFNIVYSLDKKNRWQTADTITLLGATPENLKAEVVERNGLEQCGLQHPNKSTFAVHSKQVNLDKEPGDFDIRSATSSGKGQHYSNFLPETREFSKKANAKMMTIRGQDQEDLKTREVEQPTISYNLYKTHPNREVGGGQLFKPKVAFKSGRHRANNKIDLENYDSYEEDFDEEYEQSNELVPQRPSENSVDLSTFVVENREKQSRKSKRNDNEMSYEIVESLKPETEYCNLFNIQDYLRNEGYTFESAEITFHNQKQNMEHQMEQLREEDNNLVIKTIQPGQYLIDASEWCQLDGGIKDGEPTTIIVISHVKRNQYKVLVNSTIAVHPSKKGSQHLKQLISSAMTFREAVSRITTEILTNRKIIETMKMSTLLYGRKTVPELLHDSYEWENQLVNMNWPNQYYHCTWANSEELSTVGGKLEWKDLCDMVRRENNGTFDNGKPDEKCGVCNQKTEAKEIFLVESELTTKCTDCLKDEFYREFRARRLPIDLQIKAVDELELLSTFIPLPIVNLYIRMVSETTYQDLGALGSFEKCPKCKSAVFFDEVVEGNDKKTQNRSCPCGYSWCRQCNKVPHWPLKCGDFAEWDEKWLLRYAVKNAQGAGDQTLLQVACSCGKEVYSSLLPEEFLICPNCKITIDTHTMSTVWKHEYFPFNPRFRKLVESDYTILGRNYNERPYVPPIAVYTELEKIPGIKASVIETCAAARDVRYNVHTRNRAVNREHVLIRKGVLSPEIMGNLLGTTVYLVENVTAWMYMTSQYDRNIKNTLESMMENRKNLLSSLEKEDLDAIKECAKKLRRDIDTVVQAVETKVKDAKII